MLTKFDRSATKTVTTERSSQLSAGVLICASRVKCGVVSNEGERVCREPDGEGYGVEAVDDDCDGAWAGGLV